MANESTPPEVANSLRHSGYCINRMRKGSTCVCGAASKPYCPNPSVIYKCVYCNESVRLRDADAVMDPYLNVCHWNCYVKEVAPNVAAHSPRGAQPLWISVEDRLPEPSSAVLFFTTDGCWESGYFRSDDDEPIRWECERTGPQDDRIDFSQDQVTHWCIPDPPDVSPRGAERPKEKP